MSAFLRVTLSLLSVSALLLHADPVLPSIIGDHMVLQQGRAIPVWGLADPGERIVVSMLGKSAQTEAAADRRWKVVLPAMAAGGPFRMTVRGGKRTITLKDVMVGEVWLCSGQSNMAFALSGVTNAAEEIAAADLPDLRLFTVPKKSVTTPREDAPGAAWHPSTPDAAKAFSAVAYFFGRELNKSLGVPVGLIHSSWPGTTAELWTDPESLRSEPDFEPILRRWDQASPEVKELAVGPRAFDLELRDFQLLDAGENSGTPIRGRWAYGWDDAPRSTFELTPPVARISGELELSDSSLLEMHFRPDRSPADLSAYSGVRFSCRGNAAFRVHLLEPTISDWDNYAISGLRATPDWTPVTVRFKDVRQAGWGRKLPFTPQSLTGLVIETLPAPGELMQAPSALYNGMLAPVIPFAIRGAVWYQGEGNSGRAYQYRKLLPDMIQGWRKAWGEGDFPFLIAQLPNYGKRPPEPSESSWAELREAQLMTLRQVPNTGLAVTIDLGEAADVHPKDKAPVGHRLALWALGTTYGKHVVFSGPLYRSMKVEGNRIRIRFEHAGGGLEARGGGLRGFSIAGADGKFRWADAVIEGDSVVVSSPEVPAPVAVRYAWAGDPDCNLFNKEGLPASPFRTDDLPRITSGQN